MGNVMGDREVEKLFSSSSENQGKSANDDSSNPSLWQDIGSEVWDTASDYLGWDDTSGKSANDDSSNPSLWQDIESYGSEVWDTASDWLGWEDTSANTKGQAMME